MIFNENCLSQTDERAQNNSHTLLASDFSALSVDISFPFFALRPYRTLLRLHNLRAVIFILMCLTTACEIGRAYLSATRTTLVTDRVSSYGAESVLFQFVFLISTATLLRIIEVRKSKSGEKI